MTNCIWNQFPWLIPSISYTHKSRRLTVNMSCYTWPILQIIFNFMLWPSININLFRPSALDRLHWTPFTNQHNTRDGQGISTETEGIRFLDKPACDIRCALGSRKMTSLGRRHEGFLSRLFSWTEGIHCSSFGIFTHKCFYFERLGFEFSLTTYTMVSLNAVHTCIWNVITERDVKQMLF